MANVKYDWTRIGDRVVKDYKRGHLPHNELLHKYKLKPGALWAYLRKRGVVRSHAEARATSKQHGRLKQPKQRPRTCVACTEKFQPVNPRHRVCLVCTPSATWRRRFDKYGVSKVLWDRLLNKQRGVCALCPNKPTHVDHNHKTMVVRGLLCAVCNQALRAVEANARWGERARRYLKNDTGIRANATRHQTWERGHGRSL